MWNSPLSENYATKISKCYLIYINSFNINIKNKCINSPLIVEPYLLSFNRIMNDFFKIILLFINFVAQFTLGFLRRFKFT